MNKPARRDGTPDRRKPQRSSDKRSSDRGGVDRGSVSKNGTDRRSSGNPGVGKSGVGKSSTGKSGAGKSSAGKSNFGKGSAARSSAGKGGAGKPKPQRARVQPPKPSNAKPARHQYADEGGHSPLPAGEGVRLQKVLAQAGVASRRAAELMIAAGRVEVDGRIVTEQGLRINPDTAVVRVDGTRIVVREELVHLALNKPRGWQSTMSDDLGRPCVGDIVAERVTAGQRLFHVGRLDADTEGLLLLTNDGELAHRLMHPSYEVSKTYLATVDGEVHRPVAKQLRDGVELDDGPARVDRFAVLEVGEGRSLVKVVLHEGRKHIVRRLLEEVGHPVIRLVRTNVGPVALGDQRPGTLRVLGRTEVGKLYEVVGL